MILLVSLLLADGNGRMSDAGGEKIEQSKTRWSELLFSRQLSNSHS